MQKPSPVSSIILFVCGAFLLYCAFGTGWYSLGGEGGIGLGRASFGGHSDWLISDKHLRIEGILGTMAMLFTFATAVMAVIAGVILLKPGKSVLALLAVIAMGVAMLFAIAFTAKTKEHGLDFGAGFFLFWLASAGVLAGGIMAMSRTPAPMVGPMGYPAQMPQMMPMQGVPMGGPVAQAPMGTSCTTCGQPTIYVAQYGKQFCQSCNRYLV